MRDCRLLAPAFLFLAFNCCAEEGECNPTGVRLSYPTKEALAGISGTVQSNVRIERDGTAGILRMDGPARLLPTARHSIEELRYPTSCSGHEAEFRFTYKRLEEPFGEAPPNGVTVQVGPGEFVVVQRVVVISDPEVTGTRKGFWRRLFHFPASTSEKRPRSFDRGLSSKQTAP